MYSVDEIGCNQAVDTTGIVDCKSDHFHDDRVDQAADDGDGCGDDDGCGDGDDGRGC